MLHPELSVMITEPILKIKGYNKYQQKIILGMIYNHKYKEEIPDNLSPLDLAFIDIDRIDEKCGITGALVAIQCGYNNKDENLNKFNYNKSRDMLKNILLKRFKMFKKLSTHQMVHFYFQQLNVMKREFDIMINHVESEKMKDYYFINYDKKHEKKANKHK